MPGDEAQVIRGHRLAYNNLTAPHPDISNDFLVCEPLQPSTRGPAYRAGREGGDQQRQCEDKSLVCFAAV